MLVQLPTQAYLILHNLDHETWFSGKLFWNDPNRKVPELVYYENKAKRTSKQAFMMGKGTEKLLCTPKGPCQAGDLQYRFNKQ